MENAALFTSGAIFALVSLAHGVRFFQAAPVLIGDFRVPVCFVPGRGRDNPCPPGLDGYRRKGLKTNLKNADPFFHGRPWPCYNGGG